ncbi:hypothetical protein M440DRAFT_1405429 [Trichoderma longibrachiatum ATCC 18648]|uniref:Uncharacterized protein n=1 Tax=Trichoderma longibrachiatum ATCC 18648 TaxID=983965 RepID=A0A2T4BT09_TRILO|nr:hypothetical protein M440DRAFT_1405429 [Trichoderma longibrachiatum ATCC 18648]
MANTNDINEGPSHPTPSSSTITSPPPSYHSGNPQLDPLQPALTNTHTTGTIVLPYDNSGTYQPAPKPNIVKESIAACVDFCCVPRVPPWDWSSDYSSTAYPSSLSSYTSGSYTTTESMRSRDRVSDAEPVQVENAKNKDVGYAKQEGLCSKSHGSAESSSQQCCRRFRQHRSHIS